jgi:hypothetical protein
MNVQSLHETVRQMAESLSLSESEVRSRVQLGTDPAYWESLRPSRSGETCMPRSELSADEADAVRPTYARHGYFKLRPLVQENDVAYMLAIVKALRREQWPLVFAFIYDEFWQVVRSESMIRLLTHLLGPHYSQNSHVWTYWIASRASSAGWPPHIDGNGKERVTVWIPLTDATVDNGCIYLVPRRRIPTSLAPDFRTWDRVGRAELQQLLHGSRALPAEAGSVLGWAHDVIHWGAVCEDSSTPRVSVAMEFVGSAANPGPGEHPLVPAAALPPFEQRLAIIGRCILDYRRFEPLMNRYSDVASELQ